MSDELTKAALDLFAHTNEAVVRIVDVAADKVIVRLDYVAEKSCRPSVLFRPTLSKDGDKWCMLYGANLQEGVAGFGDTPELAAQDFDIQWSKP